MVVDTNSSTMGDEIEERFDRIEFDDKTANTGSKTGGSAMEQSGNISEQQSAQVMQLTEAPEAATVADPKASTALAVIGNRSLTTTTVAQLESLKKEAGKVADELVADPENMGLITKLTATGTSVVSRGSKLLDQSQNILLLSQKDGKSPISLAVTDVANLKVQMDTINPVVWEKNFGYRIAKFISPEWAERISTGKLAHVLANRNTIQQNLDGAFAVSEGSVGKLRDMVAALLASRDNLVTQTADAEHAGVFLELVFDELNGRAENTALAQYQKENLKNLAQKAAIAMNAVETQASVYTQQIAVIDQMVKYADMLMFKIQAIGSTARPAVMAALEIRVVQGEIDRALQGAKMMKEYTEDVMVDNAKNLKTQVMKVGEFVNASTFSLEKLKEAGGYIMEAYDAAKDIQEELIKNAKPMVYQLREDRGMIQAATGIIGETQEIQEQAGYDVQKMLGTGS